MAYFSNGSEGYSWEERWCARCVHRRPPHDESTPPCAVLALQYEHNYAEANKPDSFLHVLIPMVKATGKEYLIAGQCRMFIAREWSEMPEVRRWAKAN